MPAVFWLIILAGPQGMPVHAGNFATMKDCVSAGTAVQFGSPGSSPNAGVTPSYVCVQANGGGVKDPPPPP